MVGKSLFRTRTRHRGSLVIGAKRRTIEHRFGVSSLQPAWLRVLASFCCAPVLTVPRICSPMAAKVSPKRQTLPGMLARAFGHALEHHARAADKRRSSAAASMVSTQGTGESDPAVEQRLSRKLGAGTGTIVLLEFETAVPAGARDGESMNIAGPFPQRESVRVDSASRRRFSWSVRVRTFLPA